MSSKRHSDPTFDYYEAHASEFVRETLWLDMTTLHDEFLALVRPGGRILDAGCGSGRDAREFKRRGFTVKAFDASPKLAQLASEVIGQPVEVMRFQEMRFEEEFDGIWACASLLHVPLSEIDHVFSLLKTALRPGGVLYLSFKKGDSEEVRDARLFISHSEETLRQLLARHPQLKVERIWETGDLRPGRESEKWTNALTRKASAGE